MTKLFGALCFALAAGYATLGANAQEATPAPSSAKTIEVVGLVTADTPVVLVADKRGVFGKFKAGSICQLRKDDIVKILGTSSTGKQQVQRTPQSLMKAPSVPSGESCPVGAVGEVESAKAVAWKDAKVAHDSAKAAKK